MCKLYSNDSKMYLAHIKIPTARTDTNGYYRFYVIDGYRKLKKAWEKNTTFILEQQDKEQIISINGFPTSKHDSGIFRFLE